MSAATESGAQSEGWISISVHTSDTSPMAAAMSVWGAFAALTYMFTSWRIGSRFRVRAPSRNLLSCSLRSKYVNLLNGCCRFVGYHREDTIVHCGLHGTLVDALGQTDDALHLSAWAFQPRFVLALRSIEAWSCRTDVNRAVHVGNGYIGLINTWQIGLDRELSLVLHRIDRET